MTQIWRILVFAVLAWQATATVWSGLGAVAGRKAATYVDALTADTGSRMQSVLGGYADVLDGIEQTIPPGEMILWRLSDPLARSNVDLPRSIVGGRLRHLLYPKWFMTYGLPNPVTIAELQAQPGSSLWLLLLGDDQVPAGRAGWTKAFEGERYEIWQFQKD